MYLLFEYTNAQLLRDKQKKLDKNKHFLTKSDINRHFPTKQMFSDNKNSHFQGKYGRFQIAKFSRVGRFAWNY